MKAVRLKSVGNLSVEDVAKPVPGPNELLVKIEACGVCGTDRHILAGEFPSRPPVTLGHEFCGIVEAVGSGVSTIAIGARITGDPNISCGLCPQCRNGRVNLCHNLKAIGIQQDGGFAEYAIVPESQAYEIPLSLHPHHGAFCEPLACCLHGVDMAQIKPGSSVVILGGGVIGMLTVQLCKIAGATTIVMSTRQADKRELAEAIGATHSIDPSAGNAIELLAGKDGLLPGGADVVIECAGVRETMIEAPKMARAGGTVVILGVMAAGEKIEIEPFDILFRELRVLGSFVNPFTHRRAADMIASGAVKVDRLISRTVGIEEAVDVIKNPPRRGEIRVMVLPNASKEA